jgi:hypothetical protein
MFTLASGLDSVINPDGAVILDSSRNEITVLDAMGGYVWRLLEKGTSRDGIIETLVSETGHARAILEQDLDEFASNLASLQLLTVQPSPENVRESHE